MFGLGTTEILLIILVVAVLFGARRLPELGKGLGQGLRGFKDALRGKDDEPETADIERKQDA
ncbi:MAG: twin-arginine translocase TatA/TatE family subunit [Myxococcota bacterium]